MANAILDGTDCVMLSGESAMGQYPVEAVAMLARIAESIEPHRPGGWVQDQLRNRGAGEVSVTDAIALSVETTVARLGPAAVIVPTRGGATARNVTRFRLPVWIVAVCAHEATCRQLELSYGVYPMLEPDPPDDWRAFAGRFLAEHRLPGRLAVVTAGPSARNPEANHRIEIVELETGS